MPQFQTKLLLAAFCLCILLQLIVAPKSAIDNCAPDPCVNGGICNDLINGYNCTCTPGWQGKNCTENINECQLSKNSPCMNGGICNDLVNGFNCTCTSGWGGQNCSQRDIDDCASRPCKNGGNCTDMFNGFSCKCAPGWEGQNCTRSRAPSSPTSPGSKQTPSPAFAVRYINGFLNVGVTIVTAFALRIWF